MLRDPRVAGKVAMDTDLSVVIGSTLKSLGYSLNSGDKQQLAEAVGVLQQQVSTLGLRFIPSQDVVEMMKSGELCAAQAYNGDAAKVMAENENVAFFIPKEGSDIYFDVMAIPRRSEQGCRGGIHQLHPATGSPVCLQRIHRLRYSQPCRHR